MVGYSYEQSMFLDALVEADRYMCLPTQAASMEVVDLMRRKAPDAWKYGDWDKCVEVYYRTMHKGTSGLRDYMEAFAQAYACIKDVRERMNRRRDALKSAPAKEQFHAIRSQEAGEKVCSV